MESRESQHYQTCCKYRNQVKNRIRKIRVEQEKNSRGKPEEAKTNPNKFWNFARSQTKPEKAFQISSLMTRYQNHKLRLQEGGDSTKPIFVNVYQRNGRRDTKTQQIHYTSQHPGISIKSPNKWLVRN